MLTESGYIDASGRAWDIHRFCNRISGEEEWTAESLDASGDVMEAESRVALFRALAAEEAADA
jgi:hypothetical protein